MILTPWLVTLSIAAQACAADGGLRENWRWQNRVLVVAAPHEQDQRLLSVTGAVAESQCGFRERDMLLVTLAGGTARLDDRPISDRQGLALREALALPATDFGLVLLGKDGGIKLRAQRPIPMGEIFGLIDGMPMRQREMSQRPGNCDKTP